MIQTKETILEAIALLIKGYEEHTILHGLTTCPLCKMFYDDYHGYEQNTEQCTKCPNVSFAEFDNCRGCTERAHLVKNLNYRLKSNESRLAEFWTKVYKLYESEEKEEILTLTKILQEKIVGIALSYQ